MSRLLALALCFVSSACATAPFKVNVTYVGNYDPVKNDEVDERASELPWDASYPVELFMNSVPEGLSFDQGKLKIVPGFENRYELLGTIRSSQKYNPTAAFALGAFWYVDMHDMHSRSRDVFCKVQTPLRTLTLGIWWLFSPTSWPCWVGYSIDGQENTRIHAQELKRGAAAMGANLLVVAGVRDDFAVTGSAYSVQSYTVEAASIEAFAVVDKTKPLPP